MMITNKIALGPIGPFPIMLVILIFAVVTVSDGIFYLSLWTARLAEDSRWKETI